MPVSVRVYALCLLVLLSASCAAIKPEPPQVSLVSLRVQELTLSHASMVAELRLFNPNRIGIIVEEVEYALTLNSIPVSAGRSLAPVRVGAGESALVGLRLSGSYLTLLQFAGSLQKDEQLSYLLAGSVQIRGGGLAGWTFPLRQEGTITPEVLRGILGGR